MQPDNDYRYPMTRCLSPYAVRYSPLPNHRPSRLSRARRFVGSVSPSPKSSVRLIATASRMPPLPHLNRLYRENVHNFEFLTALREFIASITLESEAATDLKQIIDRFAFAYTFYTKYKTIMRQLNIQEKYSLPASSTIITL